MVERQEISKELLLRICSSDVVLQASNTTKDHGTVDHDHISRTFHAMDMDTKSARPYK